MTEDIDKIRSVSDALKILGEIKKIQKDTIVFRGHSDLNYRLVPKSMRKTSWIEAEHKMIRELFTTNSDEFEKDRLMVEKIVRMQHYGLPTRMLDVSYNLLIALWFATGDITPTIKPFAIDTNRRDENSTHKIAYTTANGVQPTVVTTQIEPQEKVEVDGALIVISFNEEKLLKYVDSDTVSLLANLSNLTPKHKKDLTKAINETNIRGSRRLIKTNFNSRSSVKELCQRVRDDKHQFNNEVEAEDLKKIIFVKPQANNRRIIAQSGAFLLYGHVDPNDETFNKSIPNYDVQQFIIDSNYKKEIREELKSLGVSEEILFPEIQNLTAIIEKRFG